MTLTMPRRQLSGAQDASRTIVSCVDTACRLHQMMRNHHDGQIGRKRVGVDMDPEAGGGNRTQHGHDPKRRVGKGDRQCGREGPAGVCLHQRRFHMSGPPGVCCRVSTSRIASTRRLGSDLEHSRRANVASGQPLAHRASRGHQTRPRSSYAAPRSGDGLVAERSISGSLWSRTRW